MQIVLSFIISSLIWFAVFSIKFSPEPGVLEGLQGLVCPANDTLFIRFHKSIGDPFELLENR